LLRRCAARGRFGVREGEAEVGSGGAVVTHLLLQDASLLKHVAVHHAQPHELRGGVEVGQRRRMPAERRQRLAAPF